MITIFLRLASVAALSLLLFALPALAAFDNDLSINSTPLQFVPESGVIAGQKIRIYSTVQNHGNADLIGTVKFFVDGGQIATDQPVSVKQGSIPDEVFIIWSAAPGQHTVTAQLYPYEREGDNPANNLIARELFVDWDTDGDGIGNAVDTDDDNDGLSDIEEQGLGTSPGKPDTDADGVGDRSDAFPLDPSEQRDTDHDGIGDNADTDDDGDFVSDENEIKLGTNPLNPDSDEDGCMDGDDRFPTDPAECRDTDGDGVGDNSDIFPEDAAESADCDADGTGDNADPDADNDGVPNEGDALPCDATESADHDGDGIGDNSDTDDDNDGYCDATENTANCKLNPDKSPDAFPLDPTEWLDSDRDGLGDNADPNDKNQGPVPSTGGDRIATVGMPVQFDASASTDVDGQVVKWVWDFGDSTPLVEEPTTPHTFDRVGEYRVRLTITDDVGESRVAEIIVVAQNPPWLENILLWLLLFLLLAFLYIFYETVQHKKHGHGHAIIEKILRKPKK